MVATLCINISERFYIVFISSQHCRSSEFRL